MSRENSLLPGNAPIGLVQRDNFDAYGSDCEVVNRKYLLWLATVLDDRCECELLTQLQQRHTKFGDHTNYCIPEVDRFIKYYDPMDSD